MNENKNGVGSIMTIIIVVIMVVILVLVFRGGGIGNITKNDGLTAEERRTIKELERLNQNAGENNLSEEERRQKLNELNENAGESNLSEQQKLEQLQQ